MFLMSLRSLGEDELWSGSDFTLPELGLTLLVLLGREGREGGGEVLCGGLTGGLLGASSGESLEPGTPPPRALNADARPELRGEC